MLGNIGRIALTLAKTFLWINIILWGVVIIGQLFDDSAFIPVCFAALSAFGVYAVTTRRKSTNTPPLAHNEDKIYRSSDCQQPHQHNFDESSGNNFTVNTASNMKPNDDFLMFGYSLSDQPPLNPWTDQSADNRENDYTKNLGTLDISNDPNDPMMEPIFGNPLDDRWN